LAPVNAPRAPSFSHHRPLSHPLPAPAAPAPHISARLRQKCVAAAPEVTRHQSEPGISGQAATRDVDHNGGIRIMHKIRGAVGPGEAFSCARVLPRRHERDIPGREARGRGHFLQRLVQSLPLRYEEAAEGSPAPPTSQPDPRSASAPALRSTGANARASGWHTGRHRVRGSQSLRRSEALQISSASRHEWLPPRNSRRAPAAPPPEFPPEFPPATHAAATPSSGAGNSSGTTIACAHTPPLWPRPALSRPAPPCPAGAGMAGVADRRGRGLGAR